MCGICAISGKKNIATKLYESLHRLEYRGYDSCGIAVYHKDRFFMNKDIGGVLQVNEKQNFQTLKGNTGIAHTRWATHGSVTSENAHPHYSTNKKFVIVHNGIISNYQKLKEEISNEEINYLSDTDSEVFANLLQYLHNEKNSVEQTFLKALQKIEGTYAFAVMSTYEPGTVYAAKRKMPLLIGAGEELTYLSSDINAFVKDTKKMVLFEDSEYVIIKDSSYLVKDLETQAIVNKPIFTIDGQSDKIEKNGEFNHYMLKEIFDQPHILHKNMDIDDQELIPAANLFLNKSQSFLVGVGTTYFVALVGSYLFAKFSNTYVPAISSDEFVNLVAAQSDQNVMFISQSGETYDTKMACEVAQKTGAATSAIVNVVGSALSRAVDHCIFQSSGPEISVVSTKATLSQMIILLRIALIVGVKKKVLTEKQKQKYEQEITSFSLTIEKTLNEQCGLIRNFAKKSSYINNWLFMGKGIYYPIAMEAALKMKEVTYLHAEGLPAGFLKHGTLALIDKDAHSLFFMPSIQETRLYEETMIAIEEVKARQGKVISFCQKNDLKLMDMLDHAFLVPKINPIVYPFFQLITAQLFSYYSALDLKRSIDRPRNLAKSVTVG